MSLSDNLNLINRRIVNACINVGRNPSDIDMMLVTKTVPINRIYQTIGMGYQLFGENKVQEVTLKWKSPKLEKIKPEFIGLLQTNKVKACLDLCTRIHSVDRMSLVETLDRELQKRGEQREIFLQVNTSKEVSKYGLALENAVSFAKGISRYQTLKVMGLMTLAIFSKEVTQVRSCFKRLKHLHNVMKEEVFTSKDFRHLSMGMSSDFEIAIEEGATLVRIGTAAYGQRTTRDAYYWPEDH